ncbi:hypothetical protein SEA_THYATIRA_81 [Mycobacterium phage Thyatira]|uniref:DUF3039 domain-containing protein n=1 Tax=Mycobacterium phage Thyatira TaxID=2283261 RepID=A0A345M9A8_9CAUD|nr:hypothetical protein I5G76_gp20 [Mycobacterium phage Thyatira]AXH67079.1 hypothetical protein SEA_THYATIRA_81 [Mycobacterium phage Thyatira]
MSATQGSVLDRPDTDNQTATGEPTMFHYVRKTAILSSVVEGGMVQALCGEIFPVTQTPKPGSPVCPDCEAVFKELQP